MKKRRRKSYHAWVYFVYSGEKSKTNRVIGARQGCEQRGGGLRARPTDTRAPSYYYADDIYTTTMTYGRGAPPSRKPAPPYGRRGSIPGLTMTYRNRINLVTGDPPPCPAAVPTRPTDDANAPLPRVTTTPTRTPCHRRSSFPDADAAAAVRAARPPRV